MKGRECVGCEKVIFCKIDKENGRCIHFVQRHRAEKPVAKEEKEVKFDYNKFIER